MRFAVEMARVQREQHLNLLAAETIGAAIHHEASILVAAPNAGGPIQQAAQRGALSTESAPNSRPRPQLAVSFCSPVR